MGRKSIKQNKNIYQQMREAAGLTRAAASELMRFVSESRIEKIESETSLPQPDEILEMSNAYKKPSLCNYYCSNKCPLGQKYVTQVEEKNLAQIVLEVLAILNKLNMKKDRMIEITSDGAISDEEAIEFSEIKKNLHQISSTAASLQLWIDNAIINGDIGSSKLK